MESKRENYKCKQVQDFIDGKINKLIIFGNPGTGKTYALKHILSEWAKNNATEEIEYNYETKTSETQKIPSKSVKFITAYDLVFTCTRIFESFNGEAGDYDEFLYRKILAIDDLGRELDRDRSIVYLTKILSERQGQIVISTNLDITRDDFLTRYDDRILDRLTDFQFVKFGGASWRGNSFSITEANLDVS